MCKRGLIIYRINSLAQLNILPWLHQTSYIWSYVNVRLQNINKTKYYATSCFNATCKNKWNESILCTQDNEQIVQVRRSLILSWNKFPLFLAFRFFLNNHLPYSKSCVALILLCSITVLVFPKENVKWLNPAGCLTSSACLTNSLSVCTLIFPVLMWSISGSLVDDWHSKSTEKCYLFSN